MSDRRGELRAALSSVRGRIAAATARAGRPADAVTLIAITKRVPAADIALAAELGVGDVGENRVQEALGKQPGLSPALTWHLVGGLQTNKAKEAARAFALIHSVDREALAVALSRAGEAAGKPCRALLQVNITGAAGQGGIAPGESDEFIEKCLRLPYLHMCGVMAIGPHPAGDAELRRAFRAVRELRDRLARVAGERFAMLSAGMSGDFEAAIEEGSTHVRIGTALFGERRPL